jgi:predicted GNAT family acetyltransferase
VEYLRGEGMIQENHQNRIDFPSPPVDDGWRRRGACRLAVSHQLLQAQQANIKIRPKNETYEEDQ